MAIKTPYYKPVFNFCGSQIPSFWFFFLMFFFRSEDVTDIPEAAAHKPDSSTTKKNVGIAFGVVFAVLLVVVLAVVFYKPSRR